MKETCVQQFEDVLYELRVQLHNDTFAQELYAALCNMQWQNIANPDLVYHCSWRHAGRLVANIRACGEEYTDWYCSGNEGTVTDRIEHALHELGWRPLPWPNEEELSVMIVS